MDGFCGGLASVVTEVWSVMPAQAWVTLIVGLAATIGVLITWRQKNTADRRAEWWRRTTWAFERTFSSDDAEAELGWKVLETLVESKLATSGESDIVQVIAEHVALGSLGPEERTDSDEQDEQPEVSDQGPRAQHDGT